MSTVQAEEENVDPEEVFNFKVIASFKDPLTRQVTEAIKIQRAQDRNTFLTQGGEEVQVVSLNRKYENFAPQQRKQREF